MQPPECFRNISKADYYAEYNVEGKNYEARTEILKERARELGFRVEIIKLNEGLLLKIYGNSQEDVDDFVALVCNNNFTLSLS